MIFRITNRTPLLNILGNRIRNKHFGDQLFAFSHKAIMLLFTKAELKPILKTGVEKKRCIGAINNFYYKVMPIISSLTGLNLTPGLIYVVEKAD